MTDKQFCSIYTAYNGEVIDKIGQLVQTTMYGEELKELIEFFIEQAQALEKQRAIDFARHCLDKAKDLDILTAFMNVEQYYNETFKSE